MDESGSGIDALHATWSEAIRQADIEGAVELLTEDYVLWAAGASPIMGRQSVRSVLASSFASYVIEPRFEREERIVSGDLAVEQGWDVQTIRPRGGGAARTQRQRVLIVLRRGPDGRWRYARGMSQAGPDTA